jgi:hypothetical protein
MALKSSGADPSPSPRDNRRKTEQAGLGSGWRLVTFSGKAKQGKCRRKPAMADAWLYLIYLPLICTAKAHQKQTRLSVYLPANLISLYQCHQCSSVVKNFTGPRPGLQSNRRRRPGSGTRRRSGFPGRRRAGQRICPPGACARAAAPDARGKTSSG